MGRSDRFVRGIVLCAQAKWSVAVSENSRWLVSGSQDGDARLWNLGSEDPASWWVALTGHEGSVFSVAINPEGRWVITGAWDGTYRIWDVAGRDLKSSSLGLRTHRVRAIALSQDARRVATGSDEGTVRLWDLAVDDALF